MDIFFETNDFQEAAAQIEWICGQALPAYVLINLVSQYRPEFLRKIIASSGCRAASNGRREMARAILEAAAAKNGRALDRTKPPSRAERLEQAFVAACERRLGEYAEMADRNFEEDFFAGMADINDLFTRYTAAARAALRKGSADAAERLCTALAARRAYRLRRAYHKLEPRPAPEEIALMRREEGAFGRLAFPDADILHEHLMAGVYGPPRRIG